MKHYFYLSGLIIFFQSFVPIPGNKLFSQGMLKPGVAVLLVDTDRKSGNISEKIYGQFLEHINHSVVDGLYAEQIRGQGFEGTDFETYWKVEPSEGKVQLLETAFKNGTKSVRLNAQQNAAAIRQERLFLQEGVSYSGSVWIKPQSDQPKVQLNIWDARHRMIAELPLPCTGEDWQEVPFLFNSKITDPDASLEIKTNGDILIDFISLMQADARESAMFRPDLLQALKELNPPFIRWPGGSFASIYQWMDGIGPQVERIYHPNDIWGGYSDYYGFGTHEFLELCRQLSTQPIIVLKATSTDQEELQNAMNWVHYLIDPTSTEWGKQRAANGHPAPYNIPYFQIDNEPMNHNLSPEQYAEIVNLYGSRLREIAPNSAIVACGQKRSNDMVWSQKLIDIAGENFDILGCHNYEYEPENYQTGVQRIEDYLMKLKAYIRSSAHPDIQMTVLEWGLCRSYDWRAGLHAAGSLISYEKIGVEMSCPALLMRNTIDDPTWTAWIYHDHKSWFPGGGYIVEKLFRDHYTPIYLASSNGTFSDLDDRGLFFNDISQMKPGDWSSGTIDAIAGCSEDSKRIVIKAVNYSASKQFLLTRLQGSNLPSSARVMTYKVKADLYDTTSIEDPDKIRPEEHLMSYSTDMTIEMEPYSVIVIEVIAE